MAIFSHMVRFLVAGSVLHLIGFLIPGFSIKRLGTAFITAAVIASIGLIIEALFGKAISPYGRGIVGFLVSALIIYMTKYIISGVQITLIGALLASLVIGIIDIFLPAPTKFWRSPAN